MVAVELIGFAVNVNCTDRQRWSGAAWRRMGGSAPWNAGAAQPHLVGCDADTVRGVHHFDLLVDWAVCAACSEEAAEERVMRIASAEQPPEVQPPSGKTMVPAESPVAAEAAKCVMAAATAMHVPTATMHVPTPGVRRRVCQCKADAGAGQKQFPPLHVGSPVCSKANVVFTIWFGFGGPFCGQSRRKSGQTGLKSSLDFPRGLLSIA
jgi:hypothetical protein